MEEQRAPAVHRMCQNRLKSVYESAVRADSDVIAHGSLFRVKYQDVKKLYDDFTESHILLDMQGRSCKGFNSDQHDEIELKFMDMCYSIHEIYDRLFPGERNKPQFSDSSERNSSETSQSKFSLPKIQLNRFSGDVTQWMNFIAIFKSLVHENKSLSDIHKMHYLLSCVEGEAKNLVGHLSLTEGNYKVAYDTLCKRYENVRLIADTHLDLIISLPQITTKNLREATDCIQVNVSALTALEFPVTSWSFILLHIITRKLNSELRNRFELEHKSIDMPSFKNVVEFMELQCKAHEATKPIPPLTDKSSSHNTPVRKPQPRHHAFVSTSEKECNISCVLCKQIHGVNSCPMFIKLETQQRRDKVKELGLCFNCLRQHKVSNCKSKFNCKECNGRHHSLLHITGPVQPQVTGGQHSAQVHTSLGIGSDALAAHSNSGNQLSVLTSTVISEATQPQMGLNMATSLLGTLVVHVQDSNGKLQPVRALLDTAADSNFMIEACAQRLGLIRHNGSIPVSGFGDNQSERSNGIVDFNVQSHFSPHPVYHVAAHVVKCISRDYPYGQISDQVFDKLPKNITLADPQFNISRPIDFLIGSDMVMEIIQGDKIKLGRGLPSALNTEFGWVLIGGSSPVFNLNSLHVATALKCSVTLDDTLKRFWEVEEPVTKILVEDPENVKCEQIFKNTHTRDRDGRFCVKLPFKSDPENMLGDSYAQTFKRLLMLERRLNKDPDLKIAYQKFMIEYRELGHMQQCDVRNDDRRVKYFIPHHGVVRESSSTTKLRAVFDASMKTTSGYSLNDTMLSGSKLQQNIADVILRFRLHAVVFTSDIKQMYRQVVVHPDDQRYQLILWRDSPDQPVQHYRLKTVTYGTTSAPFLAMRCLHQLAEEGKDTHPNASRVLRQDIFVDDVVSGASSLSEAVALRDELISLLKLGCFDLRKWSSNNQALLEGLPADFREAPLTFDKDNDSIFKILGVRWSSKLDSFLYHANLCNKTVTKRAILSNIAKIFDPCGWLTPVIFTVKALMQELWLLSLSWDQEVPPAICDKWNRFVAEFPDLGNVRLKRYILSEGVQSVQLHGFGDASERGYGSVVYLRAVDKIGHVSVHMLIAKSKVAPIRQRLTIPRLELCAALLTARILAHVVSVSAEFLNIESISAWSDSTIVLSWIRTPPHQLKIYEANRICQLHGFVNPNHWRHVPSEMNPADCASRGLFPSELVNHPLWFQPNWLTRCPETWPKPGSVSSEAPVTAQEEAVTSYTVTVVEDVLSSRFSSYSKLVRVSAWCLRFIHNCQTKVRVNQPLSIQELDKAVQALVKVVQKSEFSLELDRLARGKDCHASFNRLHPFLDSAGIIRVGGRLRHSNLAYSAKHPMLLPKSHHFTSLLIDYYHIVHLHVGPSTLINIIRQRFWILSARSAVRTRVHKCVRCFRLSPRNREPFMGDLPPDRCTVARPFLRVGADFGGPFITKSNSLRGTKTQKSYLCVFVCFVTKAVHLEAVSCLSTEAFLAAFTRFTSRRGLCTDLYTDHGRNFVGTANHIKEVEQFLRTTHEEMGRALSDRHISFHRSPPTGSHFGGLWEAAIKSSKYHIKRVIGEQILTFEELTTIFTRVEAVLNSRPLCALSTDPSELNVLTPGHFLIGEQLTAVPEYNYEECSPHRVTRWQLTQRLSQHFWRRWQSEYLHNLQQRGKWTHSQENLKVDTLVVLKEDDLPPLRWRLGRVIELYPGPDGVVRVATVKTAETTLRRPVVKLCPLPIA